MPHPKTSQKVILSPSGGLQAVYVCPAERDGYESSCHCHGFRTPKWAAVFSRSSLCPSILYAPDAAIDIAGVLAHRYWQF